MLDILDWKGFDPCYLTSLIQIELQKASGVISHTMIFLGALV